MGRIVNLNRCEKELIRLSKGHVEGRSWYSMEDVKEIVGSYYGIEQIGDQTVLRMVISLYETLGEEGFLSFDLEDMIDQMFKQARLDDGREEVRKEDIIRHFLSEIQNIDMENRQGDKIEMFD